MRAFSVEVKAVGFDLGDTLVTYEGVPPSWASLYDPALRAVASSCNVSADRSRVRGRVGRVPVPRTAS